MHHLFNCAVVVYAGGCCLVLFSESSVCDREYDRGSHHSSRVLHSRGGGVGGGNGGASLGSLCFCGHLAVICTAAQWMFTEVWQCFSSRWQHTGKTLLPYACLCKTLGDAHSSCFFVGAMVKTTVVTKLLIGYVKVFLSLLFLKNWWDQKHNHMSGWIFFFFQWNT